MQITELYHSGLRPEKEAEPCQRFVSDNVVAFVNDIRNGLPNEFDSCDVLYAEPPWRAGYKQFNERVGLEGEPFAEFYGLIGKMILMDKHPFYMVCGESGIGLLPKADDIVATKLHHWDAWLLAYRAECPPFSAKKMSTVEVIQWLANRHQCVGDWCCGYGMTGRYFVAAGKKCVLSDYNPKCIGEIARTASTWKTAINTPA